MKGIVFCEFLEMVEETFSPDIADRIINESELQSGGAYTAVGTYPHSELIKLVAKLAEVSGTSANQLIRSFGHHLFQRFTELYPMFFDSIEDTLSFLETIDNHVHIEVRKLYPDAELPRFQCERISEDSLVMNYSSHRPLADLAHGLIEGASAHWNKQFKVHRQDSQSHDENGTLHLARFTLTSVE
jgi:hypothetical protein